MDRQARGHKWRFPRTARSATAARRLPSARGSRAPAQPRNRHPDWPGLGPSSVQAISYLRHRSSSPCSIFERKPSKFDRVPKFPRRRPVAVHPRRIRDERSGARSGRGCETLNRLASPTPSSPFSFPGPRRSWRWMRTARLRSKLDEPLCSPFPGLNRSWTGWNELPVGRATAKEPPMKRNIVLIIAAGALASTPALAAGPRPAPSPTTAPGQGQFQGQGYNHMNSGKAVDSPARHARP